MSNPTQSKEHLKHKKFTNVHLKVGTPRWQVQLFISAVLGRALTPGLGGFASFFCIWIKSSQNSFWILQIPRSEAQPVKSRSSDLKCQWWTAVLCLFFWVSKVLLSCRYFRLTEKLMGKYSDSFCCFVSLGLVGLPLAWGFLNGMNSDQTAQKEMVKMDIIPI